MQKPPLFTNREIATAAGFVLSFVAAKLFFPDEYYEVIENDDQPEYHQEPEAEEPEEEPKEEAKPKSKTKNGKK